MLRQIASQSCRFVAVSVATRVTRIGSSGVCLLLLTPHELASRCPIRLRGV